MYSSAVSYREHLHDAVDVLCGLLSQQPIVALGGEARE